MLSDTAPGTASRGRSRGGKCMARTVREAGGERVIQRLFPLDRFEVSGRVTVDEAILEVTIKRYQGIEMLLNHVVEHEKGKR